MNSFITALAPIVILILIGLGLRRIQFIPTSAWDGIKKLTYYILMPSLLIHTIGNQSISNTPWASMLLAIGGTLITVATILILIRKTISNSNPTFTSVFQGGLRLNNFIMLAMTHQLYGEVGLTMGSVVSGFSIVIINLWCIGILFIWGESSLKGVRPVIRALIGNPLVIGCAIGWGLNLSEMKLPILVNDIMGFLGKGALPFGLLAVGAALKTEAVKGHIKPDGTRRNDDEFYTDEKFGKVPVGWEVKKVKQLCERRNESFEPSQTNEILDYIGLEHIISGKFRINGSGKSSDTKSTKSKFYPSDLLYGKLRPYLNKIWLAQFDGVCSTDILVLNSENFMDWLYFNLQTVKFLNYTQSMTAGTQHPRARWKDIGRFQIILPIDENEKIEIENSLKSLETAYDDKINIIQKLERLKKALMQNLLTGKKRLNADYIQGFADG